ncbi:MAG TPA: energy transducer TonB, partial [Adhaeribacter sp.]|nr:energy transducer TonB [Adhaeribacter sp.]
KTIKFTPPVIKKDELVRKQEEVPDVEDLKEAVIDVKTQEGNTTKPDLTGLEGGKGKSEVAPAVEEIFTFVEQAPQFPGGDAAMMKYLGENIKYPAIAQRNGLEGLVVVSFVVNRKGEISDIQVMKPLGGGLSEEAVRVIKGMPKWTPGKQNGREVNVRYNLPVRFTIK